MPGPIAFIDDEVTHLFFSGLPTTMMRTTILPQSSKRPPMRPPRAYSFLFRTIERALERVSDLFNLRPSLLDESLSETLAQSRRYIDPDSDLALMPLRASIHDDQTRDKDVLKTAEDRFRQRLERDPVRLEAWFSAHAHRFKLESKTDVVAHFEVVTGHSIRDFDVGRFEDHPTHRNHIGRTHSPDRGPLRRSRESSLVLATVMAACLLILGSYESDPLRELSGMAASSESILFGSLGERTRGHTDMDMAYRRAEVLQALDHINEARTSILGLHTGYDPSLLQPAAVHLERALAVGPPHGIIPSDLVRLHQEVRRLLE